MAKVLSTCFILHTIFVMDISEVEKGLYESNKSKAPTCSTRKVLWVYEIALADKEVLDYSLFSDVPFPSLTLIYYHSIDQETSFDQWPLSPPSYELLDKRDWSSWEWRRAEHAEGAWPTGEPLLPVRHGHSVTITIYLKPTGLTKDKEKHFRYSAKKINKKNPKKTRTVAVPGLHVYRPGTLGKEKDATIVCSSGENNTNHSI